MIGKIKKGNGFKGCVNYVLGKEQATLLHAEGVLAESNRDIIRSFILQAGMNPDLKKPVGHIALSYSPVDAPKLSGASWLMLLASPASLRIVSASCLFSRGVTSAETTACRTYSLIRSPASPARFLIA